MKTKKIVSSIMLASMLLMNFSSTVFAATTTTIVNDFSPLYKFLDMVTATNGDIYAVGLEIGMAGNHEIQAFWYDKDYDSDGRWYGFGGGEDVVLDTVDTSVYDHISANVAYEENQGHVGVAWQYVDKASPNSAYLKYNEYMGSGSFISLSNWKLNSTTGITVFGTASGGNSQAGSVGLEFFNNVAVNNYQPNIATCIDTTQNLTHYKTTSNFNSGNSEYSVGASDACNGADIFITSTDYIYIIATDSSAGAVKSYYGPATPNWGSATVDTLTSSGITHTGAEGGHIRSTADLSGNPLVVYSDNNSGATDALYVAQSNGSGNWDDGLLTFSNFDVEDMLFNITYNTSADSFYVGYFERSTGKTRLYNENDANSVVVATYTNMASDGDSVVFAGYDSNSNQMWVLDYVHKNAPTYMPETNHYQVTDLIPVSTPEFSTYVYVVTILIGFGMIYRRIEPANALTAA